MSTKVVKMKDSEKAKVAPQFNAADIRIELPTVLNSISTGDHSAEYTGEFEMRSGIVNKPTRTDGTPNPNHGKKWATLQAIMKVAEGRINVTVDLASLEKMTPGQSYDVEVVVNQAGYNNARLKQSIA